MFFPHDTRRVSSIYEKKAKKSWQWFLHLIKPTDQGITNIWGVPWLPPQGPLFYKPPV